LHLVEIISKAFEITIKIRTLAIQKIAEHSEDKPFLSTSEKLLLPDAQNPTMELLPPEREQ
jgi:hypothetical protein